PTANPLPTTSSSKVARCAHAFRSNPPAPALTTDLCAIYAAVQAGRTISAPSISLRSMSFPSRCGLFPRLTKVGIFLRPGKPNSKYYEYEEAWHLLKPPETHLSGESTLGTDGTSSL